MDWPDELETATEGLAVRKLARSIEANIQESRDAAAELCGIAETATDEEALEEAERLLDALQQVRALAEQIADAAPVDTIMGVVRMVQTLRRRVAAQGEDDD